MQGWGKHYYFTNDGNCFAQMDLRIENMLRAYLGVYRDARSDAEQRYHLPMLGLQPISQFERNSFVWSTKKPKPKALVSEYPRLLLIPQNHKLARLQIFRQHQSANCFAMQAHHVVSDRRKHAAHLVVAAFCDRQHRFAF